MRHSPADFGGSVDVVVVGAGPAGAVAATLLARRGVRVALIDGEGFSRGVVGEVLPPAARPTLERLGLASVLEDPSHLRSPGTVSAWGTDTPQETDFVSSPYGDGLHLDRARFDGNLRDLAAAAGARVVPGTWDVRSAGAEGSHQGTWPVIVDCTGRSSAVARSRGVSFTRLDALVAVVGVLSPGSGSADLDARTFVASVADGWWYSALLADGRRVAAFHTDLDLLPRGLRREPRAWHARLLDVPVIGPIVRSSGAPAPDELRVLAADSRRLTPAGPPEPGSAGVAPQQPQVVAAGDAAMAFDPLSSQGILSAIQSAEEAVAVVNAHLDADRHVLPAALARRADMQGERWSRYVGRLILAYGDEQRWRDSRFWERRHAWNAAVATRTSDVLAAIA